MRKILLAIAVLGIGFVAMAQSVTQPQFPGGYGAMKKWIDTYLHYPQAAIDKGLEGELKMCVIVDADGWVTEVMELGEPHDAILVEEAQRVCKSFPKLAPGTRDGKPVRSQLVVDVLFRIPPGMGQVKVDGGDPVDRMPSFPGGLDGLMKFLADNIIYPPTCVDRKIVGKVILKFIVTADGDVEKVTVEQSAHPLLDAEAVRVAKLLPRFEPGMKDGRRVNMYFHLPVNFKL